MWVLAARSLGLPLGLGGEGEARLHLALHLLAEGREEGAHVVLDVLVRQVLPPHVARVEELEEEPDDLQDLVARRQEAPVDVLAAGVATVARDHAVDQPLELGRRLGGHDSGAACIFSTSVNRPSKSAPLR